MTEIIIKLPSRKMNVMFITLLWGIIILLFLVVPATIENYFLIVVCLILLMIYCLLCKDLNPANNICRRIVSKSEVTPSDSFSDSDSRTIAPPKSKP